MAREKSKVTEEEINILKKIVIGGINSMRYLVLNALISLENKNKETTYQNIMKKTHLSSNQVRRLLDDLYILKIIDKKTKLKAYRNDNTIYWKLRTRYKRMLETGDISARVHRLKRK